MSSLAAAYLAIVLDESKACPLPPRVEQQLEELEAAWYGGGGLGGLGGGVAFGQQQQQLQMQQGQLQERQQRQQEMLAAAKKEDTLEDVMYWAGQLAEAYPDFADKVCLLETPEEAGR